MDIPLDMGAYTDEDADEEQESEDSENNLTNNLEENSQIPKEKKDEENPKSKDHVNVKLFS